MCSLEQNPCYNCYFAPDGSFCHLENQEPLMPWGCKYFISRIFTDELHKKDQEVYLQFVEAHKNARNRLEYK